MLIGDTEPLPSIALCRLRGFWSITLQLGPSCVQHTLNHQYFVISYKSETL
jgi:hypothetical protein